jgi:hypothetical protein
MNYADYAKIDAVNASTLKELIAKSPRHYKYLLENPREETDALRFGTLVHLAVLEPGRFADTFATVYAVKPDGMNFSTKDGKAWRDEQANAGKVVITSAQYQDLAGMCKSILANPRACELLRGESEKVITWNDPLTGIACKGRPDVITIDGDLVDLKSAKDIRPREFVRACLNLGYFISMAHYVRGLAAIGRPPRNVYLVAVEKTAPYDVAVYRLNDEWLALGDEACARAMSRILECRKTDAWPGIVTGEMELDLPAWVELPEEDMDDLETEEDE